jgi:hypothetical protein
MAVFGNEQYATELDDLATNASIADPTAPVMHPSTDQKGLIVKNTVLSRTLSQIRFRKITLIAIVASTMAGIILISTLATLLHPSSMQSGNEASAVSPTA